MGVDTPDEFTKALAEEAKLDQQTIDSIVQDLNAQIFVPLREEMRKGPQPAAPAPPMATRAPSETSQGAAQGIARQINHAPLPPRPTPPAPRPPVASGVGGSNFNLQNKIPPPARPAGAPPIARPDLRSVLSSVTKEVPKLVPGEKLLEDHEEPHIEFHKAPTPPIVPKASPPPPNLPGAMPPQTRPSGLLVPPAPPKDGQWKAPTPPQVKSPAPKPPVPPSPPPQSYTTDPYREPIE